MISKKNIFKPSYKKLLILRKNVQNKKKLLKFKKKKWEKFINFFKNSTKPYKKYRPQDQNTYLVSKYPIKVLSYKKRFKNSLQSVKRFSLFYGGIKKKDLKKNINIKNTMFLKNFEQRIDSILLRSKFSTSMRNSRQLISHGKIIINNKTVKSKSYIMKEGDIIDIHPSIYTIIKANLLENIANSNIWPLPPKYLFINYKTLQIIFGQIEKSKNISSTNFYFNFNLEKIIQNYKYQ